jgi:peptide/nickel transport system ATP-binding protein
VMIVTHDLGVVAEMADQIAVMYAGRIVESAATDALLKGPEHPYTWGLLRSIPKLDGPRVERLEPIPGSPPSLIDPPSGCHFHPRCAYAQPDHARIDPELRPLPTDPAHEVACLLEPEVRRRLWTYRSKIGQQAGRAPAEIEQ